MIARELLFVALIPCAVGAIAAWVARRLRNPPRVLWAVGLGIGYVAGQLCLAGRSRASRAFWSFASPHEAVDWLPHAVLLALGVTIFASYAPRRWRRWAVFLAALLSIGLPLRLLGGSVYVTHQWSALEKLFQFILLAAAFCLVWLLLAAARDDEQPRLRPALLIAVTAGSAVAIALSASLAYSELCGAVAAAAMGTLVTSKSRGLAGAAGVITCSLGSLIVLGHFYAELSAVNAAMLILSLIFAGCRLPDFVSSWRPWQQAVFRASLCLVPLAIAVATSLPTAPAGTAADPYAL